MRLTLIIVLYTIANFLFSQDDSLFLRIEKNYQGIQSFTAEAQITVEMERLRIPRKKFTLYYKHPDKFKIESDGFAMIPRIGLLIFPNQLNSEKYELEFTSPDTIGEYITDKYLLKIKSVDKSRLPSAQQFFVWIDRKHSLLRKIESLNFRGRTSRVNIEYGKLKEGYYMPSRIGVTFENIADSRVDTLEFPLRERFPSRIPRSGSVTIVFTKYSINETLEDKLFEKER